MSLQKLKFKEVANGDEVQYFINNKLVPKETYDKLYEDESLFTLPPLPKMDHSPENNIDGNGCSVDKEGLCEDCQELFDIIQDIREMDDGEAIDSLRDYLDIIKTQVHLQTLIDSYSQFGSDMNKVSARLEVVLDNFNEQFEDDEELD